MLIYSLDKIVRDVTEELALASGTAATGQSHAWIRAVKYLESGNNMKQSLKKRLIWGPGLRRLLHILVTSSFPAQIMQKNITVVSKTGNGTSVSVMDVLKFISSHPAPEQDR